MMKTFQHTMGLLLALCLVAAAATDVPLEPQRSSSTSSVMENNNENENENIPSAVETTTTWTKGDDPLDGDDDNHHLVDHEPSYMAVKDGVEEQAAQLVSSRVKAWLEETNVLHSLIRNGMNDNDNHDNDNHDNYNDNHDNDDPYQRHGRRLISLRRHLATEDWASFNQVFDGAELWLPTVEVTTRLVFTFKLKIEGCICKNIYIDDIVLELTPATAAKLLVKIHIKGIHVDCVSGYSYRYGAFGNIRGSGTVYAYTKNNTAEFQLDVSTNSASWNNGPPTSFAITKREAKFNIKDLDFRGGFIAGIMDTFEKNMRDFVEGQLEDVAKKELSSLGTDFIIDSNERLSEILTTYLGPIPPHLTNPLWPQQQYLAANPGAVNTAIDFRNPDPGSVEEMISELLTSVNNMIYQSAPLPGCPPVLYGEQVFLQNADFLWLSGARVGGNHRVDVRNLIGNAHEQNLLSSYQWKIRSKKGNGLRSDTDDLEGGCVRYGDTVYLQNMLIDHRYLIKEGSAVYTKAGVESSWKVRSTEGNGALDDTEPKQGECVMYHDSVFFQVANNQWLGSVIGGWQPAFAGAVSDPKEAFQWVIGATTGDGPKYGERECPEPKPGSHNTLGINNLIREFLLDEDGALWIPIWQLPGFDPVLFEGHDKVSQTKITIVGMRVLGLDTWLVFDPLTVFDRYTLQNLLYLKELKVELVVDVSLRPSTFDDAILRNGDTNIDVRERVTIAVGVDHLNVVLSTNLFLNKIALNDLHIGALLDRSNAISCLASLVSHFEISGFQVAFTNIHEPVLSGFISKGLDHLFTKATEALFVAYEPTVLKCVNHMFQTTVRNLLNQELRKMLRDLASSADCEFEEENDPATPSTLDFRDLFLPAEDAAALGGEGTEPYGNIISMAYQTTQGLINEVDAIGKVGFNSRVVDPATTAMSGEAGVIRETSQLLSFSFTTGQSAQRFLEATSDDNLFEGLVDSVTISVDSIEVSNLNTVVKPFAALNLTSDATRLINQINMGNSALPDLTAEAVLQVVIKGQSALALNDNITFTMSMGSLRLLADIVATLDGDSFMGFPLQHMMDFNCWLSLVPEPASGTHSIDLENVLVEMANVFLGADVKGPSAGIRVIPSALSVFQESGATALLGKRFGRMLSEFLGSDMLLDRLANKVRDARAKCPFSSSYDPAFKGGTFQPVSDFIMSEDAIDTAMFTGVLLLPVFQIALTENHRLFEPSAESRKLEEGQDPLLDWQDLGTSLWPNNTMARDLANKAFQAALDFINGSDEFGEPNLKSLLNNFAGLGGEDENDGERMLGGSSLSQPDCPPVLYGDELFLQNADFLWLSGARVGGNHRVDVRNLIGNAHEQNLLSSYQWKIRSKKGNGLRSDTDDLEGGCVRYGDTVYLQNMLIDHRYLIKEGSAVYTKAGVESSWKVRSTEGNGALDDTEPKQGECVMYHDSVFFQVANNQWLGSVIGGWQPAFAGAVSDPKEAFQWVIGATTGDGPKYGERECPEPKPGNRATPPASATLSFNFSDVVVELGDLSISIDSATIAGLDTFTEINVLNATGPQTLSNTISMEELSFELQLSASSNTTGQSQTLNLYYEVEEVKLNMDILAAFYAEEILSIEVGSILFPEDIIPCLSSAVHLLQIETFELTVGGFAVPEVSGLQSETDQAARRALDSLYADYMSNVVDALPLLTNTTLKQLLNNVLEGFFDEQDCPERDTVNLTTFVDFRDLFLESEQSMELGGKGDGAYGTLLSTLYEMSLDLLSPQRVNEWLGTFTTEQSGTAGRFEFLDLNLLSFSNPVFEDGSSSKELWDNLLSGKIELGVQGILLDNVNNIVDPLKILSLKNASHRLDNELNIGNSTLPNLTASAQLSVLVEGSSALALNDELEFALSLDTLQLIVDIMAKISSSTLMKFPVRHIVDLDCWMSLIPLPVNETTMTNLDLERFILSIKDLFIGARQLTGSSAGLQVVPAALSIMQETGATELMSQRLESLLSEVLQGQSTKDRLLNELQKAHSQCPFSPSYDPGFDEAMLKDVGSMTLSSTAVDTAIFSGSLLLQTFTVALLRNHLNFTYEEKPGSGQSPNTSEPLLNFQDLSKSLSQASESADEAFEMIREYLGGKDEQGELNVNVLIGNLTGDDAFVMDLDLSANLGDLLININSVSIEGMDSFRSIDVLNPSSPYTLTNNITMERLSILLDFSITSDSTVGTQSFQLGYNMSDIGLFIDLHAAFFVDQLLDIELGSILHMEDIMPCLMASAHDVNIKTFEITVGDFAVPTISGLQAETDEAVRATLDALFTSYSDDILLAIPKLTDTTLRQLLNNYLRSMMEDDDESCPDRSSADLPLFVDFRDLFLDKSEALELGGSGSGLYGSLGVNLYSLMERMLYDTSLDGTLMINDLIVDPVTKSQSGIPGKLDFADLNLLSFFNAPFLDNSTNIFRNLVSGHVELGIDGLLANNLNTFVKPLELLHPTTKATSLGNEINMGNSDYEDLMASVRLKVLIEGDSALAMDDEIELSVSLDTLQFLADIVAKFRSLSFMSLPLRHILDYNCWLALIPAPAPDSASESIKMEPILLEVTKLILGATVVSGSTAGVQVIPEAFRVLGETGSIALVGKRLEGFLTELLQTDMIADRLANLIRDAHATCPVSPLYDEDFDGFASVSAIPISNEAKETFIYGGMLLLQVFQISLLENHRQYAGAHDSALRKLAGNSDALLDWQDLGGSLDIGTSADEAFEMAREFLSGTNDQGELNLNALVDSFAEDGTLLFQFDDLELEMGDLLFHILGIELQGLSSFTQVDILNPLTPQTLSNNIGLEELSIRLDLNVTTASTGHIQHLQVKYSMSQIQAAIDLHAAFYTEKLLDFKLGSILVTDDILPCLMATAHQVGLETFLVTVQNFSVPELVGLGTEMDNSTKETLDRLYAEYMPDVIEALPILTNTTLKQMVNNYLDTLVADNECPVPSATEEFFDLGDLFAGLTKYGDLFELVRNLLDSELLVTDENGELSALNGFIRSVTSRQSGLEGTLSFAGPFLDLALDRFYKVGIDLFELVVGTITAENVDTVQSPALLLEPSGSDPSLLENRIELGTSMSPLRILTDVRIASFGHPFLSTDNVVDLGFGLEATELFAAIRGKLKAQEFLDFPIRDVANFDCWLSMFQAPELDNNGLRKDGEQAGLAFETIKIAIEKMLLYGDCSHLSDSCSSGLSQLSSVFAAYAAGGITDVLKERLELLIDTLASGPLFQTFLDRLLVDAAQQCGGTGNAVSYPPPPFVALTDEILDTIVFAATYAFEAAIIVVFESHRVYEGVEVNPLEAQELLDESIEDIDLLNFQNLSSSLGSWADAAFNQLRSFVSDEAGDNGEESLGIELILKAIILDDYDNMVFDLSNVSLVEPSFSITLGNLTISGLDRITRASLLEPIGPQTLMNEIEIENVVGELQVNLVTDVGEMNGFVRLEMAQFRVAAAILLAVNVNDLWALELGNLLQSETIFDCLLGTVSSVVFPVLDVSAQDIISFEVGGFSSGDLELAVQKLTGITLTTFKASIMENFSFFFNFSVKAILNSFMDYFFSKEMEACPKLGATNRFLRDVEFTPVDFRDLLLPPNEAIGLGGRGQQQYGDMLRKIVDVINDNVLKIDENTGLSSVNGLIISELTEEGRMSFEGDLLSGGTQIQLGGLDLQVDFRAFDAYIDNLDTVGAPFSLLDPVMGETSNLNNSAAIGLGAPLTFGSRFFLSIVGSGQEIVNDLDITLSLETVKVMLEFLMRLSEARFYNFPLKDMLSTDCLLTMIPAPTLDRQGVRVESEERSAGLVDLAISVALMKLNVSCVGTCSEGINDLAKLLSTSEATEGSTEVANDVFDYVTDMLGGTYLQVAIDRYLNEAHRNCPSSPLYEGGASPIEYESFELVEQEESIRFLLMLAISAGCIIIALLVVMIAVKFFVHLRHRRWVRSLPQKELEMMIVLQNAASQKDKMVNEGSKSMFRSQDIPLMLRLSMPFIILGNVGFFLSGHLSLGATVNIVASLGGDTINIDNFFEFSIMKSTIEIWNAGGTELAIMLLIFSVIWPYTKQFITLALWFMPPKWMSVSRRGSYLVWLDFLAKWSMVDIFTLILTVAGFRISIQSPEVAFLPNGFYSIDLVVVPMWGLYANFIAQLISQISSHFIIHYHRRIETREKRRYDIVNGGSKSSRTLPLEEASGAITREESTTRSSSSVSDGTEERLCSHAFQRPHRCSTRDKLLVRRGVSAILVTSACIISILVLLGCVFPSFSVEILGFIGVIVESGQGFSDAKKEHSVFTIMQLMMEQANFTGRLADKVGLGSLAALLLFSVLVVPVAQTLALIYMWFAEIGKKERSKLSTMVETLQAWQYSEVFLLSVVVTSWQLGPVSNFMINSYCNSLDEFFAQLVFYGILKKEDAQCFRVEANVENGSYLIAAGAVALALLNTFVMKAVIQYFRELESAKSVNDYEATASKSLSQEDEEIDSEPVDVAVMARKIHPVPVLCTDTFRWFFVREDAMISFSPRQLQNNHDNNSHSAGADDVSSLATPTKAHIVQLPLECRTSTSDELEEGLSRNGGAGSIIQQQDTPRTLPESPSSCSGETLADEGEIVFGSDSSVATSNYRDAETPTSQTSRPPIQTDYEFLMDTLMQNNVRDLADECQSVSSYGTKSRK